MTIRSIRVKNFRSIIDEKIFLRPYTVLVGANNSGKSNFVDAIRAFYGSSFLPESDSPRINARHQDDESFVDVEFTDVSKSHIFESWRSAINKGSICVRRYFTGPKKFIGRYIVVGDDDKPIAATKPEKATQNHELGKLIYIPSISKPVDDLRTTGPSILRNIAGEMLGDAFCQSKEYLRLSKAVDRFSRKVLNCGDCDAPMGRLKSIVDANLRKQWNASFKLEFKPLEVQEMIKVMLEVCISDLTTRCDTDISRFGSGFQRNVVFQLIRAGVEVEADNIHGPFRILLFEEPEAFLHFDQQEELDRSLRKLVKTGVQVLCTTHSTCFAGGMFMDDETTIGIVRLEKSKGCTRSFSLSESDYGEILRKNGEYPKYLGVKDEDNTAYLDRFRYATWFRGQRASAFFAKRVLLVEGPTDEMLISRLVLDNHLHLPEGMIVVNCLGKYNFHRFMRLFRRLGIQVSVMYDDDSNKKDQKEREKQANWNKFVKQQAGEYSPKIKLFAVKGDIESFLAMTKLDGRDDVKPFHLLCKYGNGECHGVEHFCEEFEKWLGVRTTSND